MLFWPDRPPYVAIANSLALQGTYTFSKAIGETQTARNPTPQNILYWRGDRGPVDFDRTHVFSMNYIYSLPLFRDRRNLLGQVLGNWQISGFITMQSGLAMSPGLSISNAGLATRPDATGANKRSHCAFTVAMKAVTAAKWSGYFIFAIM